MSLIQPFPQYLHNIIKKQTVRARELKFWENVHPPQRVMCHVSCVMCHVSHVTCHVSHVTCHYFFYYIFFCLIKCWKYSVEGLLSTGPTPSSLWYEHAPKSSLVVPIRLLKWWYMLNVPLALSSLFLLWRSFKFCNMIGLAVDESIPDWQISVRMMWDFACTRYSSRQFWM